MATSPRTLEDWIDYAHARGLAVYMLAQFGDGVWHLKLNVFAATKAMAVDRIYSPQVSGNTPAACFAKLFAQAESDKTQDAEWIIQGVEAAAVMASARTDEAVIATLRLADREYVTARREGRLPPDDLPLKRKRRNIEDLL